MFNRSKLIESMLSALLKVLLFKNLRMEERIWGQLKAEFEQDQAQEERCSEKGQLELNTDQLKDQLIPVYDLPVLKQETLRWFQNKTLNSRFWKTSLSQPFKRLNLMCSMPSGQYPLRQVMMKRRLEELSCIWWVMWIRTFRWLMGRLPMNLGQLFKHIWKETVSASGESWINSRLT